MTYRDRDRVVRWLEAGNGEKLTLLDRVILRDIAEAANSDTGQAWLGQATLSARWGVTTRAVKLSITRLHRHGLLDTLERGKWHRRARYVLAGEVANPDTGGTTVPPVEAPTGGTSVPYRGNARSLQGEPPFPHRGNERSPVSGVIPEGSRRDDDSGDDDAPPRGPDGPRRRGQGQEQARIPTDTVAHVMAMLAMDKDAATTWVESKLNGHTVRNIDAYIRKAVENYSPPKSNQHTAAATGPKDDKPRCKRCGNLFEPFPAEAEFPRWLPLSQQTVAIRVDGGVRPVALLDLYDREHGGFYHPAGTCPPRLGTICNVHQLPQPCRGCAADRKARKQEPNAPKKYHAWPTVVGIAALLGVEADKYEADTSDPYDEDELTAYAGRAGLAFMACTSPRDTTVTVLVEDDSESGTWPEDKSLPDERFHNRAVSRNVAGWRQYRPADALTIAEHWHNQTKEAEITA